MHILNTKHSFRKHILRPNDACHLAHGYGGAECLPSASSLRKFSWLQNKTRQEARASKCRTLATCTSKFCKKSFTCTLRCKDCASNIQGRAGQSKNSASGRSNVDHRRGKDVLWAIWQKFLLCFSEAKGYFTFTQIGFEKNNKSYIIKWSFWRGVHHWRLHKLLGNRNIIANLLGLCRTILSEGLKIHLIEILIQGMAVLETRGWPNPLPYLWQWPEQERVRRTGKGQKPHVPPTQFSPWSQKSETGWSSEAWGLRAFPNTVLSF